MCSGTLQLQKQNSVGITVILKVACGELGRTGTLLLCGGFTNICPCGPDSLVIYS